MTRPNLLFIMADQFRADAIGCVGGWAKTPHLDALARQGVLFSNAYANSAECIPSRLSLATGLYPHQFGVAKNQDCMLDPAYPNWMRAIADAGYSTSLFGKTHLHAWVGDLRDRIGLLNRYGFQCVDEIAGPRSLQSMRCNLTALWEERGVWDAYRRDFAERFANKPHMARPSPLPLDLYYDTYVGRVACEHLRSAPLDRPWFCTVSFGGPHEPWDTPEPYASLHALADMPAPRPRIAAGPRSLLSECYRSTQHSPRFAPGDVAAMRANYAGAVTLIDEQVGGLISLVEQRGELENTVIVFTSDHGEMNGDYGLIYKANFQDPAIKIPLIVSAGGRGRSRCERLVELMDVGATLADYAGAPYPGRGHGVSLRPALEGEAFAGRTAAVSEFGGHVCVIDTAMKCELDGDLNPVLAFDRVADGDETRDIAGERSLSGTAEWARAFMRATPAEAAVLLAPPP